MEQSIGKKSFLNTFFLIFILIPFFKPDVLTSFSRVNYIFTAWLVASFCIIFILYIKKGKLTPLVLLYLAYFLVLLISTLNNNGNMLKLISNTCIDLGMIMLIEMNLKNNKIKIFKILSRIFYILVVLNTFSFLIFPKGIAVTEFLKTPIYLLGIDNRFAFTYIPGLCIVAIYDILKNNKLTKYTFIYFFITFTTFVYFWSAGALLTEFLFILYYLFIYKMKFNKFINKYFITVIVAFVSLVFLRIQNLFKFLIVDILHKDLTLSSRTILWDKAIAIIEENKLIGVGIQKTQFMIDKITAFHAHSNFLNIMLQSGLIGFSIYLLIFFNTFKRLHKHSENIISQLVAFTIFIMLIMLLVDTFDITANLFMLISIGYNISYFKGEENYEG